MHTYLEFEKPIAALEGKVQELRRIASEDPTVKIDEEVARLQQKAEQLLKETYSSLTPWQRLQVARHPNRPHYLDYVDALIEDYTSLSGDRNFADDQAVLGGMGRFRGRSVMVLGHEKGNDTQSRVQHNFGLARPEGYRKAVRLMELAQRFQMPVITLVDTSGAYPGIEGEERGQAEAIARSTDMCLALGVPLICVVIGEGGSGGAVSVATGNKVYMLENAVYSVISPEACSSILWRSGEKAQEAASAMKINAQSLAELKVIDAVIEEPLGGAHRDPSKIISDVGGVIDEALQELDGLSADDLRRNRREKFLAIGRTLG